MKILIISKGKSDFSRVLSEAFSEYTLCVPGEMPKQQELEQYDAFAVLGGIEETPLNLYEDEKDMLESQMKRGAKVFIEYVNGFATFAGMGREKTRFARPVMMDNTILGIKSKNGTLYDEQSNDRIIPMRTNGCNNPILQYVDNPEGFYCLPNLEAVETKKTKFALWMENPELMVCTFRMLNFAAAKFAPQKAWGELVAAIVRWLGGECCTEKIVAVMQGAYHMSGVVNEPAEVARRAVQWFHDADMLVTRKGKPYGVLEGLNAHVKPDGTHVVNTAIRYDCTGEVALMYYLKACMDNDAEALNIADALRDCPLDGLIKDGLYAGMERWTVSSWFACYQDDAARGLLLPELWRAYLSGDHSHLEYVKLALDYLLSTTGTDGLRVPRTDFSSLDRDEMMCMTLEQTESGKWNYGGGLTTSAEGLRTIPSRCPSAHYNAFYMASLLLYGKLTGDEKYIKAGEKGMETFMEFYPKTAREHSQTQELCRLILPMSLLYWVTEDDVKKEWVYRVTDDLLAFRHQNGGFHEWDEGYLATCAGTKGGESSVLSENGDPVADLLYSVNWLTMGFAVAYLTTQDEKFQILWKEMADFFSKTQIVSDNKRINGAWPRSIDLDNFEVYGVPNDVGWAPWSIESGWTVAEIASGLMLGELLQHNMDVR